LPAERELQRAWHVTAGKWRKGVNVEIRQCRRCGQLLLVALTPKGWRTELHRACMIEQMREPATRTWLSDRQRLRADGVSEQHINRRLGAAMPKSGPQVRQSDPRTVTRDFCWAVLHLLGGDSHTALAAAASPPVTRQVVMKAVRRIIELLPDAARTDAHFAPVVAHLRAAWEAQRAQDGEAQPVVVAPVKRRRSPRREVP
jgi:hypothetical protein